jgi:hypothetical protein
MTCNCRVCNDHRRWLAALNPQTDEAQAALDEILSRLEAAETDAAVSQAKLDGKWNDYMPDELDPTGLALELIRTGLTAVQYKAALEAIRKGPSLETGTDAVRCEGREPFSGARCWLSAGHSGDHALNRPGMVCAGQFHIKGEPHVCKKPIGHAGFCGPL